MIKTSAAILLGGLAVSSPLSAQQKVELPARDRALAMELHTLFTLGAVDGEDYENFGLVSDVGFDARGNVYVLDAQAFRVVVFDAKGAYLRSIGRQGGGPGELTFPSGIALLPGGGLLVNDAGRGSLQEFDADGNFVRSIAVDEELGRVLGRLRTAPGGEVITETSQIGMAGRSLAEGGRITLPPRSITALAVDDVAHGTRLFNAAPRQLEMSTQRSGGGGARFAMALSAFEPQLLWTPLPGGGVAASNQAGYRVTLTDGSGRPTRYLERPIEPRAVTAADRKRWLERQASGAGGAGMAMVMTATRAAGAAGARPSGAMRVDAGEIAEKDVNWGEVVPVVNALGTDSFGRLWVQRSDADLGDGPIDIIDAGLRYLGTLPEQAMPRAFGPDGRVAYVVTDDLDVPHVVVKQIKR